MLLTHVLLHIVTFILNEGTRQRQAQGRKCLTSMLSLRKQDVRYKSYLAPFPWVHFVALQCFQMFFIDSTVYETYEYKKDAPI